MTERLLPEYIDPFRYAEQALRLRGEVKLTAMPRLQAMVRSNDSRVVVELQFGVDEQKIPFVKGKMQTTLQLQCQRCMDPYQYEIITGFALGIVTSDDEAGNLPSHYEPVLTKEGQLALRELVEEELILNLPIIPKHDPKDCKLTIPVGLEQETEKMANPFHVLESLKRKD